MKYVGTLYKGICEKMEGPRRGANELVGLLATRMSDSDREMFATNFANSYAPETAASEVE